MDPQAFAPILSNAPLVMALLIWTGFWKALALWHSARRGETVWFIVLLIVNTLGILEIIYLFAVAKRSFNTLFSKNSAN